MKTLIARAAFVFLVLLAEQEQGAASTAPTNESIPFEVVISGETTKGNDIGDTNLPGAQPQFLDALIRSYFAARQAIQDKSVDLGTIANRIADTLFNALHQNL